MRIDGDLNSDIRAIGEIFPHRDHADNTDKTATIRVRAGFKPGPDAGTIRGVRKFAQPVGEDLPRAGVNGGYLDLSPARPTFPPANIPRQGDLR